MNAYIPENLRGDLDQKLACILESNGLVGLKPNIEVTYLPLTPDSMYAHIYFLKEAREYRFPIDRLPIQFDNLIIMIAKDIIKWINEELYAKQTIPQESV